MNIGWIAALNIPVSSLQKSEILKVFMIWFFSLTFSAAALSLSSSLDSLYAFPVKDVSLTFFVCLLIYHLFFFFQRNSSSSKVLRYIDYAYLASAAFAVWIAASELTQKNNAVRADAAFDEADDLLHNYGSWFHDHINYACRASNLADLIHNRSRHSTCATYISLSTKAKQSSNTFSDKHSRLVYNLDNTMSQLNAIASRNIRVKNEQHDYEPDIDSLLDMAKRLGRAPFAYPEELHPDFLDRWKSAGYILAASALAMRITRVTIELRGWHKKAS